MAADPKFPEFNFTLTPEASALILKKAEGWEIVGHKTEAKAIIKVIGEIEGLRADAVKTGAPPNEFTFELDDSALTKEQVKALRSVRDMLIADHAVSDEINKNKHVYEAFLTQLKTQWPAPAPGAERIAATATPAAVLRVPVTATPGPKEVDHPIATPIPQPKSPTEADALALINNSGSAFIALTKALTTHDTTQLEILAKYCKAHSVDVKPTKSADFEIVNYAAVFGTVQELEILHNNGFSYSDNPDRNDNYPLHYANTPEKVHELMKDPRNKTIIDQPNKQQEKPIILALDRNEPNTVAQFLKEGTKLTPEEIAKIDGAIRAKSHLKEYTDLQVVLNQVLQRQTDAPAVSTEIELQNLANTSPMQALRKAVDKYTPDDLDRLLKYCADKKIDFKKLDKSEDLDIVTYTVQSDQADKLRILKKNGFSYSEKNENDNDYYALNHARSWAVVDELMTDRRNIEILEQPNKNGLKPVEIAHKNGRIAIAARFVTYGSVVKPELIALVKSETPKDNRDSDYVALNSALKKSGQLPAEPPQSPKPTKPLSPEAELIKKEGSAIDALYKAVGSEGAIDLDKLLKYCKDKKLKIKPKSDEYDIVSYASFNNKVEALKILQKNGFSYSQADTDGSRNYPLHFASSPEVIDELLTDKANKAILNKPNKKGYTPVMVAIDEFPKAAAHFLDLDVKLSAKDIKEIKKTLDENKDKPDYAILKTAFEKWESKHVELEGPDLTKPKPETGKPKGGNPLPKPKSGPVDGQEPSKTLAKSPVTSVTKKVAIKSVEYIGDGANGPLAHNLQKKLGLEVGPLDVDAVQKATGIKPVKRINDKGEHVERLDLKAINEFIDKHEKGRPKTSSPASHHIEKTQSPAVHKDDKHLIHKIGKTLKTFFTNPHNLDLDWGNRKKATETPAQNRHTNGPLHRQEASK